MNFKHKINIFLENKKWLDKKIFKSKKSIDNFIYYLSQITINECFLQPKFKKFKNLKTNINFILADDRFLKKLNNDFLNKNKEFTVNEILDGYKAKTLEELTDEEAGKIISYLNDNIVDDVL